MTNFPPLLLAYGLDLEGPIHRGIATYAKAMIRLLHQRDRKSVV